LGMLNWLYIYTYICHVVVFGFLLLKLDFCHANHLLHTSLTKNWNLLHLFSTILWNHEWLHHKFICFHIFKYSKRNSSLKYTFDKNFRCLSIFYNQYECFSPATIKKIIETSNFQKNIWKNQIWLVGNIWLHWLKIESAIFILLHSCRRSDHIIWSLTLKL
jgi:hypothetical protein